MLRITLTKNEKQQLHEAKKRHDIPNDRITAILLAADGLSASKIASALDYHGNTIREYIKNYQKSSIGTTDKRQS